MVFQKKATSAVKMDQVKRKSKKFEEEDDDIDISDMEEMDDSDDDESSSEETQVQKTPQNKTPKGKQPQSDKKVSFKMPGKNTPAKTPNKDNSALAKKQSTPGSKSKTAVQQFKGMKKIQNSKSKKGGDDDDDEDDDDDDEDEDMEDDDLDLQLDDDEDDDDEEEEDDDDDDDEEDEESNEKPQKKLKANAMQNKQTPAKNGKGAASVKNDKSSPKKNFSQEQNLEIERRRQRDLKMLYIGGLPNDIKPLELKALSSDIEDCIMPNIARQRTSKTVFAFLVFASEKKAEENYKTLQTKKFRGQMLKVDFVGEKSKNKKPSQSNEPKNFNMRKLHVTGIPISATLDKVANFFPQATMIAFNHNPQSGRTASVSFSNEEDANEAFKASMDISIEGHKLTVLHSLLGKNNKKHKRRMSQNKNVSVGKSPAKRMKKMTSDE